SPNLATHWDSLEGGKIFTFTLRDDVVFHDGHPLDAQAVVDSFELARTEVRPATALRHVRSITATSPRSVRVELLSPLPIFPVMLTDVGTAIARLSVRPGGEQGVVGTGPFQLVVAGKDRRLLRFDGYRTGGPRVDAVVLETDVPIEQIASGMRAGKFDLTGDLPPAELEQLLRARKGFKVLETGRRSTAFVVFNSRSGPCSDERLRAVLSQSVHTHEIVWRSLARFALPAVGVIPPGVLAHDAGRRRTTLTREEALDQLGQVRPPVLRAAVTTSFARKHARFLEALFGEWRDVGVEVRIVTFDLPTYEAAVTNGSVDLLIVNYSADYGDPDDFTHSRFHSRAGQYRNFFGDAEVDRLCEEGRITPHTPLREKLYHRAEERLLQTSAVLPLFHDMDHRVVASNLSGVKLRSEAPYVNFAELAKLPRGSQLPTRRDRGGVLHIPFRGSLSALDPAYLVHDWQHFILGHVLETLVCETEGGGIGPHLARDFRMEDGGRRYRFFLQENVLFHDGRRLSARDVRASWERLSTQPGWAGQTLFPIRGARALARGEASTLEGFEILSPLEFVVHLEEPMATFAAILSQTDTAILPEGTQVTGNARAVPVGTGPFRVARIEPGTRLELEAHPGYWRTGYPRADMVVCEFGVAPHEAATRFEQGRASLVTELLVSDAERLRATPRFGASCSIVPSLGTYAIYPHVGRAPMNDPAVRQRLFAAVDVAGAVLRHVGSSGSVASTYLPPAFLDYEPSQPSKPRPGGIELGDRIPIRVLVGTAVRELYGALVTEILDSFSAHGFAPTVVSDLLDGDATGEEADVLIARWYANYPSADGFLFTAIHSGKGDYGRFSGTPEVDELLERARREPDPSARQAIYRAVEAVLAEHAIVLPLFHPQSCWFVHPDTQGGEGVVCTPASGYPLEHLWVRS
ncbi:MAG: putative transporter, periplasmic substrate-binding protein, partial [Deltaproteobacteria bacterium]|nr:putative transporter, periplasmic substrate-binding protein [Deltaproteobacteria bacterium]